VGDTWRVRPSNLTRDRSPHPDLQLTLMNCRVAALVAEGTSAGSSPVTSSTSTWT
jgi:hypothetical protein